VAKIENAIIFAAGLGTRMLPLTENLPKPMVEVAGQKLIDIVINKLLDYQVKKIVINTYYKAELLENYLTNKWKDIEIVFSREKELLDTGGGVIQALNHFENKPFFALNSDTIWFDGRNVFELLEENWDESKMDMLLLLAPTKDYLGYEGKGDFDLTPEGQLKRKDSFPFVFTGVQVFNPEILKNKKIEKISRIKYVFEREGKDGIFDRIYGVVHDGEWLHIGSVEGLAEAEEYLKKKAIVKI
jgi:MurNAc alpha-1-phosphate uridylyltransferase